MNFGVSFSPLVPSYIVWAAAVVALVIALLLVLGRARGAVVRALALALFVLALANPSLTREDRDPLTNELTQLFLQTLTFEVHDRKQYAGSDLMIACDHYPALVVRRTVQRLEGPRAQNGRVVAAQSQPPSKPSALFGYQELRRYARAYACTSSNKSKNR